MSSLTVETKRSRLSNVDIQSSDSSLDCGDRFRRSWYCVRDGTLSVWSWIADKLCCGTSRNKRKSRRRSPGNKRKCPIKQSMIEDKATDPAQTRRVKFKSSHIAGSEPEQNKEPTGPSDSSEPDPTISTQRRAKASKSTYSMDKNKEEPMRSVKSKDRYSVISDASQSSVYRGQSHSIPSPPKIEFVETGSIFSGRNRHATTNHILLDNGRFKSPGQSNITTGPGGRAIRISFQTGFPSMKSLESRASLQSVKTVDSKVSQEGEASANTLPDLDPEPNEA